MQSQLPLTHMASSFPMVAWLCQYHFSTVIVIHGSDHTKCWHCGKDRAAAEHPIIRFDHDLNSARRCGTNVDNNKFQHADEVDRINGGERVSCVPCRKFRHQKDNSPTTLPYTIPISSQVCSEWKYVQQEIQRLTGNKPTRKQLPDRRALTGPQHMSTAALPARSSITKARETHGTFDVSPHSSQVDNVGEFEPTSPRHSENISSSAITTGSEVALSSHVIGNDEHSSMGDLNSDGSMATSSSHDHLFMSVDRINGDDLLPSESPYDYGSLVVDPFSPGAGLSDDSSTPHRPFDNHDFTDAASQHVPLDFFGDPYSADIYDPVGSLMGYEHPLAEHDGLPDRILARKGHFLDSSYATHGFVMTYLDMQLQFEVQSEFNDAFEVPADEAGLWEFVEFPP